MSKSTITDPRVKIRPSEKLVKFIATLKNESSMPKNVLEIYQYSTKDKKNRKALTDIDIPIAKLSESELKLIDSLKSKSDITLENLKNIFVSDEEEVNQIDHESKKKSKFNKKEEYYLNLTDIKWLNELLIKKREKSGTKVYLHELLLNSNPILPQNEIIERDPVLEARCQRLRLEQSAREYKAMTKNVDNARKHIPEDTIAFQSNFHVKSVH